MATSLKNLSEYNPNSVPNASELSIGIVVAEWNMDVNTQLLHGAVETLQKHGVHEKNIIVNYVPGSFELTYGARVMAENYDVDAIIVIGTVIQGETPHFTYICQSVSYGITELNLSYDDAKQILSMGGRNEKNRIISSDDLDSRIDSDLESGILDLKENEVTESSEIPSFTLGLKTDYAEFDLKKFDEDYKDGMKAFEMAK